MEMAKLSKVPAFVSQPSRVRCCQKREKQKQIAMIKSQYLKNKKNESSQEWNHEIK